MTTSRSTLSLTPEHPRNIAKLTAVTEVFPDSEFAILAIVAKLKDGQFAVWSEITATRQPCTPAETFDSEGEALVTRERLIDDLREYAYPDANA